MAKRAIPTIKLDIDRSTKMALDALKENIETMNGSRGGKLSYLNSSATLAEVITKVNDIIRRLQD